eukprot:CAMPEP_0179299086 /NCGR_PEP_ID=MMETSP0797-20121207/46333_1 /TAXON_ID=47934 /ORGANISM="Dinophysis acuminata, Strain DAEP01" /LENGTH=60 /DNA_ID=CAMNT_0021008505 /DNA_START=111 /DNA_END=291 /DNA_ORIENTATION=+
MRRERAAPDVDAFNSDAGKRARVRGISAGPQHERMSAPLGDDRATLRARAPGRYAAACAR